jgi:hypothetical protein
MGARRFAAHPSGKERPIVIFSIVIPFLWY